MFNFKSLLCKEDYFLLFYFGHILPFYNKIEEKVELYKVIVNIVHTKYNDVSPVIKYIIDKITINITDIKIQ